MIARLMNVSSTVQRRSATSTNAHGSPVTGTTATATVSCYIEQKPSGESEILGRQNTARAEYLYVCPAGTSIDVSDRVVIGSTTYEVQSIPWQVRDARTGNVHHIECTLVEVTG